MEFIKFVLISFWTHPQLFGVRNIKMFGLLDKIRAEYILGCFKMLSQRPSHRSLNSKTLHYDRQRPDRVLNPKIREILLTARS